MKEKLLLTFALLLTAVTGAWADDNGSCGDVSYSYVESTNTLTISGTGAMEGYYDPSKRPWDSYATQIETLVIKNGVTRIGNLAFLGCDGLTTVTIPASVTSIGDDAFASTGLTSIEIPASVTSIGNGAFASTGLTSIEIPASVTSIGEFAFADCYNLATVTVFAPSCTLGDGAFDECNNLANIYVLSDRVEYYKGADNWSAYVGIITEMPNPNGKCGENVRWVLTGESSNYTLTISGTGAMADYASSSYQPWKDDRSSIKTVVIGAGVTTIGNYAFYGCTGLTSIEIPASVTTIGGYAFRSCSNLATVTFAEGSQLTSISTYAFANTGLTSIEIPASVTSIGNSAFNNTGLTSINIPASVTSIGNGAFINCSNLEAMTVDGENAVYDSRDNCNAIIEKSSNTLIAGCKNTTIPDDVTIIRDYAFNGCTGLTSIEIPASVTSIGGYAFYGCTGLTSIEIPAGVTSIGVSAFEGCSGLTSIEIPAGVTSIGVSAFYGCTGLTSIEIPASVTTIGNSALQNCSNLATVTVYAPSCTLGDFAFSGCNKLTNIYVLSDLVDYYQTKENWKSHKSKITAMTPVASGECGKDNPGDVTWRLEGEAGHYRLIISGTGAMADYLDPSERPWDSYATQIETLVIENGVTRIGEAAFVDCESLTTVTIPASVTTIGDYAFLGCESLTTVTIPASVTSIGYGAFGYCSNIATMTVEAGNTVYDSRNGCNAIIEKESNTLIFGCKNTIIPDDVTSIGNNAFESCTGLTTITIPASVTSIGNGVFAGCSNLATMTVEAGNTVYDSRNVCNAIIEKSTNTLIAGCKGSTIPTTVTSIGNAAFSSCSGLTSITIPASVKSIGDFAFDGCDNLTSITIPATVTSIGFAAFQCCYGLTSITIPATVTSIGDYAFGECENLATVTVFAPSCSLGDYTFNKCDNLANIYVFSDKVVSYKTAWSAYADKIAVMFDGTSTTTVNFDNDVTVNGVLYNRTFTEGKPSTVMLPFSLGSGQTLTGGTLYKFSGVTKNETTGKWEATMTETTTLQANTPYLLLPDENLTDGKVTFNLNNSTVTLNTTDGGGKETADQGSHWTFKGTYEYMKWTTDTSDPDYNSDRAKEIGRAYGFAGVAKTGIEVGDFVKVASGAKIRPMGCYLLWNDTPNASRAAARGAATEELPQSITVRLVSADGEVTGIGEIDTKTGEMTFDSEAWYTLNGVRLSGKPTKKGLYIMNGKKVVVK